MNKFILSAAALLALFGIAIGTANHDVAPRLHDSRPADRQQEDYFQRSPMHISFRYRQPEMSCRIDPKTGCHFGHDEDDHPGGCHCDRDNLQRR